MCDAQCSAIIALLCIRTLSESVILGLADWKFALLCALSYCSYFFADAILLYVLSKRFHKAFAFIQAVEIEFYAQVSGVWLET